MSSYEFFRFKCRNCFKLFALDEKCFNFTSKHRAAIEDITDLRVPFLVGDEESAKICEDCERVLTNFTKIKQRMIELQKGFIKHFWLSRSCTSDFGGSSTQQKSSFQQRNSSVAQPVKPSAEKKKPLPPVTNPIVKNKKQPRTLYYCDICDKTSATGDKLHTKAHKTIPMCTIEVESLFSCDRCSYKCGYKSNMVCHMKKNHSTDDKKCSYCGICIPKSNYIKHLLTFHRMH